MRNLSISALILVSLTACNQLPESTSNGTTLSTSNLTDASQPVVAVDSQQAQTDDAHVDCSKYTVIGHNWRNRNFAPSTGVRYVDDLEFTSDCKMRRSYCNQEFSIPSTLDATFTTEQTIQITVSNSSYDGCFTPGTVTCKIQKFYDSGLSKWSVALNCAGTRVPYMSYIEE